MQKHARDWVTPTGEFKYLNIQRNGHNGMYALLYITIFMGTCKTIVWILQNSLVNNRFWHLPKLGLVDPK